MLHGVCLLCPGPSDFPCLNYTMQRDFCNPRALLRVCQKFLGWFWLFQRGDDQAGSAQRLEVPGKRAVMGAGNDCLTSVGPRKIISRYFPVAAHFAPDG